MIRRRDLVAGSLAAAATPLPGAVSAPERIRDRFWLWGHEAGSHNQGWDIPKPSRITPAEAAFYLGIPNLIVVRYHGKPEPPFDQYALALRPLREVVWSVVGAGGATGAAERDAVFALPSRAPNLSGVMMDDFFDTRGGQVRGALSLEELDRLQQRLKAGASKLDLWVVLYNHQLDAPVAEHLKRCDVVTLWTWKAEDLTQLSSNLERAERLAPGKRIVLGCYMWDYGIRKPMPVDAMKAQCEQGLRWLEQGRIDGMIFLASCIADLELEAVEWTRTWIGKVGARNTARRRR